MLVRVLAAGLVLAGLAGCAGDSSSVESGTMNAAPESAPSMPRKALARTAPIADLSKPGAVVWGSAAVELVDTKSLPNIVDEPFVAADARLIRSILPKHDKLPPPPKGEPNDLVAGATMDEARTIPERLYPSISSTGWNPPDPTLAVGPNHVLVAVNQDVAWYDKVTGAQQFRTNLGSPGSPGFFEPLGAQNFCFDPKVVYDHHAGRFVVMVLETYGETEAWIDIAVSDDSDPNGTWYKYRTDAVVNIGTNNVWWDFPGLGYDQNAYYVTGNLFSLTAGGSFGGAGFRVFTKAPLLTGGAAVYATLRDGTTSTVMPALHFGTNSAAYFARVQSSTSIRVFAITNPTTAPALVGTNVTVPSYSGAIDAPTVNGTGLSNAGLTMPFWRNGKLVLTHNASINSRNVARWHEFNTNTWPTSGSVTRTQSGDIDPGLDYHTLFPAIGINAAGDIGVVIGRTSASERVGVAIAGRRAADPTGRMGVPVLVKAGERDGGGRWGDYQAVAIDPVDDTTFWTIGEYNRAAGGWQNWVSSFRVSDQSVCHPVADDAGPALNQTPKTVDVLANDWHSTNAAMTIQSFAATSALGGSVTRSVGTGPGGRDQLVYVAPALLPSSATDSFAYTVTDTGGNSASSSVVVKLYNPTAFRNPETPIATRAGVDVDYYALASSPTTMPNFVTLEPASSAIVPNINYASSSGAFATSGLFDNVGAVFEGYVTIAASDLYTFYSNSDDGSKLYIGNKLLIDNDGQHGMIERASAMIGLKPGTHRLRVEFFDSGGAQGLIVSFQGTALAKQVIPASRWVIDRCPADLSNGSGAAPDGAVDINDLLFFLVQFEAGSAAADLDNGNGSGTADGAVDINDLLFFLTRFENGC